MQEAPPRRPCHVRSARCGTAALRCGRCDRYVTAVLRRHGRAGSHRTAGCTVSADDRDVRLIDKFVASPIDDGSNGRELVQRRIVEEIEVENDHAPWPRQTLSTSVCPACTPPDKTCLAPPPSAWSSWSSWFAWPSWPRRRASRHRDARRRAACYKRARPIARHW